VAVNPSIWSYIISAGFAVKFVMLTLLLASIVSWAIIIERTLFLRKLNNNITEFEEQFWHGNDLTQLYHKLSEEEPQLGLSQIFVQGFKEFIRTKKHERQNTAAANSATEVMQIAGSKQLDQLEGQMGLLATIGSVSPYIGLFGTVWGIISALQALGEENQATIAMVAPGISEALIATALGLFAAIPAVIAYNRFTQRINRLANQYQIFQSELLHIIQRGHWHDKNPAQTFS